MSNKGETKIPRCSKEANNSILQFKKNSVFYSYIETLDQSKLTWYKCCKSVIKCARSNLQGNIIRILKYFITKLYNFTNVCLAWDFHLIFA